MVSKQIRSSHSSHIPREVCSLGGQDEAKKKEAEEGKRADDLENTENKKKEMQALARCIPCEGTVTHTHTNTRRRQDKLNGDDKALQAIDGGCSSSPRLIL